MKSFAFAVVVLVKVFEMARCTPSSLISAGFASDPLCMPKEWLGGRTETVTTFEGGKRTSTSTTIRTYYSAVQQKIKNIPYYQNTAELLDYPAKTAYTIKYEGMKETCEARPLTEPFREWCLPGQYKITVDPDTWFGTSTQTANAMEVLSIVGNLTYRVTLTPDHIPMFSEIYGRKDGAPYFENILWFNISAVSFPKTGFPFSVPDSCKHAQSK